MNKDMTKVLNNGVKMPSFGFGVFEAKDGQETRDAVYNALINGYKLIDTAAIYKNEKSVGDGIKDAILKNSIKREDIFLTTKVWNSDVREGKTKEAFEKSLNLLGVDYIDLYLIHWPVHVGIKEAWQVMESLCEDKRVRAIGVSNFRVEDLKMLSSYARMKPAVNQIELHPYLTQTELREFCKSEGIVVEAWSPIMKGKFSSIDVLNSIADKYKKTVAQVILRWHVQSGIIPIPKSVTPSRIKENIDIFDFSLDNEDIKTIDNLNKNYRYGPNPDNFKF